MKAVGYIRVSTTNQDVLRQTEKFKEYCNSKGYINARIITDFGISGATFEREGYKMLQGITADDADIVVISELSRLSRKEDILETLNSVQSITSKGLKLVFLDSPDKIYSGTLDLQEIIILTVSAHGAAQERLMIKRRNQEGKVALFENVPNALVDGKIPYGYDKITNPKSNHPKYLLEVNESEAATVKTIFDLILNGNSVGQVVKYLFNAGIRNTNNKPFTRQYLGKLIANPLYKGERIRKGKTSYITPIIESEDWDKVQILVNENHLYTSNGTTMYNPLRGIMRCRCGKAMMVKNKGGGVLVYRCSETRPKYMNDENRCTYMDSVRFDLTNELIFSYLKAIDFVALSGNYEEKVISIQNQIKGIQNQISDSKNQIQVLLDQNKMLEERYMFATVQSLADRIQEQIINNQDSIKGIERSINKMNRNIEHLNRHIDSLLDLAKNSSLDNLDIKEQSVYFRKHIEKIEYIPVTSVQGFYRIYLKAGIIQHIAARKTTKKPRFSVMQSGLTVNDDATITLTEGDVTNSFNLSDYRTKRITINEYFDHYGKGYLDVNLDYRKKYSK